MPRLPASVSLGAGGCAFAHDPASPVGSEPVMWLPEIAPATVMLEAMPGGFQPVAALDAAQLGTVVADLIDGDAREIVVLDGVDELHIRLQAEQASSRPAVLVSIDSASLLRLDVASRFVRRLYGQRVKLLPPALRLTTMQRARLIRLLHAFDVHEAGGGARDVAEIVLRSDQANFPSVEWKDSHARRAANRLLHDSIALVQRGYLKLLRGG